MTSHDREKEKMLAEAFRGEWSEGPAAKLVAQAAGTARRRRRYRQTSFAIAAGAGLAATVLFSLHHERERPSSSTTPMAATRVAPAYEIISDDELLQQLPDLPVLIQRDEHGRSHISLLESSGG